MIRTTLRGAALASALLLPSASLAAQRPIAPGRPNDTRPSIPLNEPRLAETARIAGSLPLRKNTRCLA